MSTHFYVPYDLETARAVIPTDPLQVWINFELDLLRVGRAESRMLVEAKHLAPTGFLHATVVTALADITCGYATAAALPDRECLFATLEIKTNFMDTCRGGELRCTATARHLGRTTQVWDAEVSEAATGRVTALFRCTQMLWKKHAAEPA